MRTPHVRSQDTCGFYVARLPQVSDDSMLAPRSASHLKSCGSQLAVAVAVVVVVVLVVVVVVVVVGSRQSV